MKKERPWFLKKGETQRAWKSIKRQQWKAVEKAISNYRLGCAYSPAYEHFEKLRAHIGPIREAQSCKRWGR